MEKQHRKHCGRCNLQIVQQRHMRSRRKRQSQHQTGKGCGIQENHADNIRRIGFGKRRSVRFCGTDFLSDADCRHPQSGTDVQQGGKHQRAYLAEKQF